MAVTWIIYDMYKKDLINNTAPANLAATGANGVKMMLCASSYTPNNATDQYASTPQTNEVANGTSYAAGGANCAAGASVSLASHVVTFTCSNGTWAQDSSTGFTNALYAVLYANLSGTMSTNPLICYANLGSSQSIANGSLTLAIDANGVFTLT